MVIVLIHNPETGRLTTHFENAEPQHALAVLNAAVEMITQQIAGPKLFLPNGQAKIVPTQNNEQE